MSFFGNLMAGVGAAATDVGGKFLDEQLAQQRAQVLADIQRTSSRNIEQDRLDMAHNNAPRANADAAAAALSAGDTNALIATDNASDPDLNAALRGKAAADAAAALPGQIATETAKGVDLSPGQTRYVNGVKVASNDKPTTADAYFAGVKGQGAGSKTDHFDAKEYDTYRGKMDASIVALPDPSNPDKAIRSDPLVAVWKSEFTRGQNMGLSPQQTSDQADATVGKLKQTSSDITDQLSSKAAQDVINDIRKGNTPDGTGGLSPVAMKVVQQLVRNNPDKQITQADVTRQLLQLFVASGQKAPIADPTGATPAAVPSVRRAPVDAAPVAPAAPAPSIMQSAMSRSGAADPAYATMSLLQLSNIADSPRQSPAARASAQAELQRRQSSPTATNDINDPATYAGQ